MTTEYTNIVEGAANRFLIQAVVYQNRWRVCGK